MSTRARVLSAVLFTSCFGAVPLGSASPSLSEESQAVLAHFAAFPKEYFECRSSGAHMSCPLLLEGRKVASSPQPELVGRFAVEVSCRRVIEGLDDWLHIPKVLPFFCSDPPLSRRPAEDGSGASIQDGCTELPWYYKLAGVQNVRYQVRIEPWECTSELCVQRWSNIPLSGPDAEGFERTTVNYGRWSLIPAKREGREACYLEYRIHTETSGSAPESSKTRFLRNVITEQARALTSWLLDPTWNRQRRGGPTVSFFPFNPARQK